MPCGVGIPAMPWRSWRRWRHPACGPAVAAAANAQPSAASHGWRNPQDSRAKARIRQGRAGATVFVDWLW